MGNIILALVSFLIGLVLLFFSYQEIKEGKASLKMSKVTRKKKPIVFAIFVSIKIIFGLFLIGAFVFLLLK